MTIREYLKKSIALLKKNNINSAELDAEVLILFFLKKTKTWLYANFNYQLNNNEIKKIDKLINIRAKNIPIAQITKHKEFYKLDFFVNKNVLIPRPETEIIIDEVQKEITRNKFKEKTNIIDIGVGSGAILITLAKNIKRNNINFLGIEISSKAIYVAKKNIKLHKINKKIKIIKGDLLLPILKKYRSLQEPTIITANLPYLTPKQFKKEKSIQNEPQQALVSGKDGLKDYRHLFQQVKTVINYNIPLTIFIEINPSQAGPIKKIIKSNFSHSKIQIKKDLNGLDRIIAIKF